MNYFKIVILSLLLSIHCGMQSSTLDDLDDDFFDDILDDIQFCDYLAQADNQNYQDLNYVIQDDNISQISDDSYQNNVIAVVANNDIEAEQNHYNLITPKLAGQKIYSDVYRQLCRTDEPADSENNKRARAQAAKAQEVIYQKVYYQMRKDFNKRSYQKRGAMQNGGVSTSDQINLVDQSQFVENSNNNDDNLYQNENIDDQFQAIVNMNGNISDNIFNNESVNWGMQSSSNNNFENDFFYDDRLNALIDNDSYRTRKKYYKLRRNKVAMQNDIEAQQYNNDSIISRQAGQRAYDDVYNQLRKINEPHDSENNKRARAKATKARRIAYKKVYYQTDRGKASQLANSKKYNKSKQGKATIERGKQTKRAQQNDRVSADGQTNLIGGSQAILNMNDNIDNEIYDLGVI